MAEALHALNEMRQKRHKAVVEARALHEKCEKENRSFTAEEDANYRKWMAEARDIKTRIEREEALIEEERALAAAGRTETPGDGDGDDALDADEVAEESRAARVEKKKRNAKIMTEFRSYLRTGVVREEGRALLTERRDLQISPDTQGGYLAPETFVAEMIKALDAQSFVRSLAHVIPIKGVGSIGAPSLDADPADSDWTTEVASVSADTTLALGKRSMSTNLSSKLVKVGMKLLAEAAMSPDVLVRNRLAYKFGITEEKAFLTGSGVNRPLGVFTASANGVPTGRDVSTGNSTTAIGADNLRRVKQSLRPPYRRNASWIFHTDAITQIALLKDGSGRYLWQDGLKADELDTLLGRPVYESEFAPNTFTTGLYVGILGDFSNYWILDSAAMEIQVLKEKYADTNQVGYIGRMFLDGAPVLGEAFARVKLA